MINKVEICGVNTAKLPVLKNEEMRELFARMQAGDKQARQTILNGNLRLVLSVVKRFNNRSENLDDLFQVGCIGLIKATDNFDLKQGVRFSTYAVPMIIGEMRRYLRDNNPIRVSRSLRDLAYKTLQTKEMMTRNLRREPKLEEIAEQLKLPVEDIVVALDAISAPISLFEPVYHDSGDQAAVMDQISDDKSSDELWTEHLNIKQQTARLSPREQKIIDMRFFFGKTQMEVAEEIGISQAQVSRLEKAALKTLRRTMQ